MLLPSNTKLVNTLSKSFPKWMQKLFDYRCCQIYKNERTNIETLTKKEPRMFLNVTGLEDFEPHSYSMLANALTFVKQEGECSEDKKNPCRLFIKCPQGLVSPLRSVSQKFCINNKLPDSVIKVEKCGNPWQTNIIDHICNNTDRLSVGLLQEQRSNQHQAHAVRPQEFGFKLSDVFDYYAEAMEWKDAYQRHKCSVMLRMQPFSAKDHVTSVTVFEHATAYGEIAQPVIVATPNFTKNKVIQTRCTDLNLLADSVYGIYQFCVRLQDSILDHALTTLTTYSHEEIEGILTRHKRRPESFYGHRMLAENIIQTTKGVNVDLEPLLPDIRYLYGVGVGADFNPAGLEKLIPTVRLEFCEGTTLHEVCELIAKNLPEIERPSFERFLYDVMVKGSIAIKKGMKRKSNIVLDYDHIFTKDDIEQGATLLTSETGSQQQKRTYYVLIKWDGL